MFCIGFYIAGRYLFMHLHQECNQDHIKRPSAQIMEKKYTLFLWLFSFCFSLSHSQNLVPNASFEAYNHCPAGVSTLQMPPGTSSAKDWYVPTTGTADYFNTCGVRSVGVPANGMGYQVARTGDAYAGAYIVNSYREYLQSILESPLVRDHEYLLSFWVSLSDKSYYASDQIAAYFSDMALARSTNFGDPLDDLRPQISSPPGNWLSDTSNWTRIRGTMIASGNEKALILGNFSSHSDLRSKVVGGGTGSGHLYGYYYFDDICVFDVTANSQKTVNQRSLCPDSFLVLQGQFAKDNYIWSTGDTTASLKITQEGIYWVKSYGECAAWVDTFHVALPDMPANLLGKDTVLCISSSITLLAPTLPGTTFYWQDGSHSEQYTISETGTYSIHVRKEGCLYSDSIQVIINNFRQDLGNDTLVCKHTPYRIALQANVPPGAEVGWQDGSSEPVYHAEKPGTYYVVVRDPLCINTDSITITEVLCDCVFHMPNAFSPNQDGLNDIFQPVLEAGCPVSAYSFSIFNRYGQRLFHSSQPGEGWDGRQNNSFADAGTYFYQIIFTGGTQKKIYQQKGDLILLR